MASWSFEEIARSGTVDGAICIIVVIIVNLIQVLAACKESRDI